jgi:hypothetical protein
MYHPGHPEFFHVISQFLQTHAVIVYLKYGYDGVRFAFSGYRVQSKSETGSADWDFRGFLQFPGQVQGHTLS